MAKWIAKAIPLCVLVAATVAPAAVASAASGTTPTTTMVTSSAPTAVVGQSVKYTATVSSTQPNTDPTGTVVFSDNGNPITCTGSGDGTLVGVAPVTTNATSVAQCTTTYHAPETSDTITATYGGDSTYASSAGTTAETVNQANTTLGLAQTSPSGTPVTGQTVVFTATLAITSPGAGTPTGTVTFTNTANSTTPCNHVALSGLTATCSIVVGLTSPLPTIQAAYSGDANFKNSTSGSVSVLSVTPDATTVLVSAVQGNSIVTGQTVTFQARVVASPPGSGTPTGTVNFSITPTPTPNPTTPNPCTSVPLNGGSATCTIPGSDISLPGDSTIQVSATYSGSVTTPTYSGNTSSTIDEGVVQGNTNLGIVVTPKKPSLGGPVTLNVVAVGIAPASGTPTGSVSFLITAKGAGPFQCQGSPNNLETLSASGDAQCIVSSLPVSVSKLKVTVSYFGDSNWNPASVNKKVKL
jgi:large repetitive protein